MKSNTEINNGIQLKCFPINVPVICFFLIVQINPCKLQPDYVCMVLTRSVSGHNRSRTLNRGMKLWNLNGMKSKQIKLFIIVIFTACIIWGWDKASRPSVLVLHPDSLSLFRPGFLFVSCYYIWIKKKKCTVRPTPDTCVFSEVSVKDVLRRAKYKEYLTIYNAWHCIKCL